MSRRRGLLAAVIAVLGLLLSACTAGDVSPEGGSEFRFVEGQPAGEVIEPADRQPAPEVTGELLDGTAFNLADYQGQIVILNFWASWCAPCRVEAPDLEQVYQTYQGDGLQLVGILVRDSKAQGEAYSSQVGLSYPSVFDPKTKVALRFSGYPVAAIPSTIVIDRDGRVAAAYVAMVDLEGLTSTVEKLLAE